MKREEGWREGKRAEARRRDKRGRQKEDVQKGSRERERETAHIGCRVIVSSLKGKDSRKTLSNDLA